MVEGVDVCLLGFLFADVVPVLRWRTDQVLVLGLAAGQQLVLLLQALPDQEYLGHDGVGVLSLLFHMLVAGVEITD